MFVSIAIFRARIIPFTLFHISYSLLLSNQCNIVPRAVRCDLFVMFTYLEMLFREKKKKKKTIDSSDGEKLSSRNFSLPERDRILENY